jgi:hypothetical protein
MELLLVVILGVGLLTRNAGVVVNALLGLGVTFLPAVLERDYQIPMDAGLTLWITSAVFFHAVGTVVIPGIGSFYGTVWWWDHFTHALSASVVAGVGYATTRAVDLHTEAVYLPPRFTFVFILIFTIAFGVFWEVIEFGVQLFALATGTGSVLTQYGLDDTMLDLVFDSVGGVLVAAFGSSQLGEVVDALRAKLETRTRV